MATTVAKFIQAVAELILCFNVVVDESGFCGPAWKATAECKSIGGCAPLGTLALGTAARLRASRGSGGQFSSMVGSGGLRGWWGRTPVGLTVSHEC